MEHEYNFTEMTKEQLQQKYNWNINIINKNKNEISNKKWIFNICPIISGFTGWICIPISIYLKFGINFLSNIIMILLCGINTYCIIYSSIGMDSKIKELEDRIFELENENEIIKKQLGKVKEVTDNGIA